MTSPLPPAFFRKVHGSRTTAVCRVTWAPVGLGAPPGNIIEIASRTRTSVHMGASMCFFLSYLQPPALLIQPLAGRALIAGILWVTVSVEAFSHQAHSSSPLLGPSLNLGFLGVIRTRISVLQPTPDNSFSMQPSSVFFLLFLQSQESQASQLEMS